ncbi:MAG: prenyltransferase/squalene oxidase repeat-containing protein [Verrucomicrobiota bacterium]
MAAEIALLEEALNASPGNWKTRRFLIDHWVEQGDGAKAAALVKEAPELPEDEVEKIFAAEVLGKADADGAHKILDGILSANAASATAHLAKARLHLDAGDIDKAESHMKVASVVAPELSAEAEVAVEPEPEPAEVEAEKVEPVVEAVEEAVAEEEPLAVAVAVEDDDSEEVVAAVAVAVEEEKPSQPIDPTQMDESTPVTPRSLRPPPGSDAEAGSAPVKPRSLRPPGAAEDKAEKVAAVAVAAGAATVTGAVAVVTDGTGPVEGGERSFMVAEGEAISVHDKDSDTKEKLSALTTAVLVHVAIALLLGLYVIAVPHNPPPQFSVQASANADSDDISSEKVQKMQKTKSSPVTAAMPVISVAAFSSVAIPEVTQAVNDLAMVSMSADTGTGFGMSMGGFGDVSNMGSIPTAMRSRCSMSERMKRLRESGGDPGAERVVRNALGWLALNQNKDGSWGKDFKCAMTGVALLAYLGHCETPESPKYGEAVVNGALYLMDRGLKNKGKLWNTNIPKGQAYTHGMATYGLAELYTMTKESGREIPRLESVLRKAAKIIVDGQDARGGWNYAYRKGPTSDLSVGGWQFQALKALHNTGRDFSGVDKALDKAVKYVKSIQDSQGAFKYNSKDTKGKKSMGAVGMLALQMWHQEDSNEGKKGMAYNRGAFKNPGVSADYYTPYYATQVFFLHGGDDWKNYNTIFQKKLLAAQNKDGSWSKPNAGHGEADSQILATCWATLTLEVYYRYLPTTDKIDGLKVGMK